jgi:hypothetical protein
MCKSGDRALYICFGNNEAAHFYFCEYINRNQTFILDSHQHFICNVDFKRLQFLPVLSEVTVYIH